MTNVHAIVFEYVGWTNVDADDIHDGVKDAIDWCAWTPGVFSAEKHGVTCTLVYRMMKNGRGEMTRAVAVNVSFADGRHDINTNVYEW